MKQLIKNIYILGLILFAFFISFVFYNITSGKNQIPEGLSPWEAMKPAPFSGYVCGYSKDYTFLQLPFFISPNQSIDLSEVVKISLTGTDITMDCKNYRIYAYKKFKSSNLKMGTLSFRVMLPSNGVYVVENIEFVLKSGEKIQKSLDEITVKTITKDAESDILEIQDFIVSQTQGLNYKVKYYNTTSENIEMKNVSFSTDMYNSVEIHKYKDFSLKEEEDDLIIPPNEERTFTFSFKPTKKFVHEQPHFFYMLPYISYSTDNKTITALSQTQATIVQTPFTEDVIQSILYR